MPKTKNRKPSAKSRPGGRQAQRNRRRRQVLIQRGILVLLFLVILIAVILFLTKPFTQNRDKGTEAANTEELAKPEESTQEKEPMDASSPEETGGEEADSEEATASADEASTGDEDTETKTAAEAEVNVGQSPVEHETIALDGLDTSAQGWGPGVNFDDWNRPAGALTMQDKYKDYNAFFIHSESEEKNLYLTFDEGYENGYSEAILDTLKEKKVRATFFITAPYARQNPELVKRMIAEGHTVGNHSVNHPSAGLPSESIQEQTDELMVLHDYVLENFDYTMNVFRFPAGIFSEQSLAIVNNCNYSSVFWSFAYKDYDTANQMDHSEALEKLDARLHPGAIYLLHAVSSTNAAILGDFIDDAAEAGYTFCTFD